MPTAIPLERHGISLPIDHIADVCRQHGVEQLAVFGSYLRDDFGPNSDIDFLVVFDHDDLGPWMSKLQRFEARLGELLGRAVDVTPRRDVEASANWIRRAHILDSARVIYGP